MAYPVSPRVNKPGKRPAGAHWTIEGGKVKRARGRRRNKKLPSYLVEMAGVYWTASRLCSEGLIPSIPPRNLPRFDLPVTSLDGRVHATVQVKSRATRQGWMIAWYRKNLRLHVRPNHFYVLVDISNPSNPERIRALVIPSSVVSRICLAKGKRIAAKKTRRGGKRKPFPISVNPRNPVWEKYWERWHLIRRTAGR